MSQPVFTACTEGRVHGSRLPPTYQVVPGGLLDIAHRTKLTSTTLITTLNYPIPEPPTFDKTTTTDVEQR